jgi:hypothetical protein
MVGRSGRLGQGSGSNTTRTILLYLLSHLSPMLPHLGPVLSETGHATSSYYRHPLQQQQNCNNVSGLLCPIRALHGEWASSLHNHQTLRRTPGDPAACKRGCHHRSIKARRPSQQHTNAAAITAAFKRSRHHCSMQARPP